MPFTVIGLFQQRKGGLKMGSRTQWIIIQNDSDAAIHLYSHSGGEEKFGDTQNAIIAAMPRWNDPSYGARIFISNIVRENWDSETGFGIGAGSSSEPMFEESYYPSIVNFATQQISLGEMSWSFDDFVSAVSIHDNLVEEFWGARN
jgi:hypothetical protein